MAAALYLASHMIDMGKHVPSPCESPPFHLLPGSLVCRPGGTGGEVTSHSVLWLLR